MKNWNDVTLAEFYQIQELLAEPDDYTVCNILDLLYDVDSSNMPINEFAKYNKALDFLNNEVPVVNLKDKYTINGTTYNSNFNLTTITAAQFIDYQNYTGTNKWEDFLSVFFIPEGHTYNDGYDVKKVKEDMLKLDFPTVKSLAFFFTIQFEAFTRHFLSSLKKSVKKMKLTKEQKVEIYDKIEKADLANLVSYL